MSNVKRNFIYNSIYQILLIILPIITTPYISRVIGAEGLGTYSYSYSIASCFALICVLGVGDYGSRSIAKVRDDKNELNKIVGGTSAALYNAIARVFQTIYDIGYEIGSAIRRAFSKKMC